MNFWSRFVSLCQEKQIPVSRALKLLNIPVYVQKNWQGSVWPHGELRARMAEFFGVPEQQLTYTPEYASKDQPRFSLREWKFIQAYRRHPHLQASIDKLLDFHDEES